MEPEGGLEPSLILVDVFSNGFGIAQNCLSPFYTKTRLKLKPFQSGQRQHSKLKHKASSMVEIKQGFPEHHFLGAFKGSVRIYHSTVACSTFYFLINMLCYQCNYESNERRGQEPLYSIPASEVSRVNLTWELSSHLFQMIEKTGVVGAKSRLVAYLILNQP